MALSVLLVSAFLLVTANAQTPVVLWHGMGDTCCNPLSMGMIKDNIEKHISGVYVKSLMIGNNVVEDFLNGFLMNCNDQIDLVCKQINEDSKLSDGYNAIGFSQGGQFLRALAQRCPHPPMKNLTTYGGQHQGVFGLPNCGSDCDETRGALSDLAYIDVFQDNIVQAEYWHDSLNEELYETKSVFMANINQEPKANATYKTNLLKLENLILIMWENDTVVVPRESEWFGFYNPGQDVTLFTLQESDLYKNDTLGLKLMNEGSRLHFFQVPGNHMQVSLTQFDKILQEFFY